MEKMQFTLFSEISFEVSDPIALIECFCYQNDFYKNYDLLLLDKKERIVKNVNRIGARIEKSLLDKCDKVIEDARKDLKIWEENDLDSFLKISDDRMKTHIEELNKRIIQKLLKIKGIGLSKVTKILHTCYPELIPMIDNPLQVEYKKLMKQTGSKWDGKNEADKILFAFYQNLKNPDNYKKVSTIHEDVTNTVGLRLTKIRVFDIMWWSFLKAKNLKEELEKKPRRNSKTNKYKEYHNICWTTMKRIS